MGEDYIHGPAPECQVCGEEIGEDEPTVRHIKPWGLAHERCVCALPPPGAWPVSRGAAVVPACPVGGRVGAARCGVSMGDVMEAATW